MLTLVLEKHPSFALERKSHLQLLRVELLDRHFDKSEIPPHLQVEDVVVFFGYCLVLQLIRSPIGTWKESVHVYIIQNLDK